MPDLRDGNLQELQELLLAAERDRLDKLEGDLNQLEDRLDRLKNKSVDAAAVAKVLPDAIRQRSSSKQDQDLEESFESTFVSTFKRTVNNKRDLIIEAISPVMMSAIRSAIQIALHDMARTLDHSGLSWRGMAWRWEAFTTRKTFREVVLSHTVMWQVERVFLFFREDGIHLADVHLPGVPAFEPGHEDLVSSMFSAIKVAVQKFAQDEFQASEHSSMNEFKMDDGKTVLIEQGPKAVLAAVVRGLPSESLRPKLQDALTSIHSKFDKALQNFRGDRNAFEAARPHLESCLIREENDFQDETGSTRGGISLALVVMLVLLLSALGWWVVTGYLDRQREADEQLRWAHFLEAARGRPGIQITHTQPADGKNGKTIVYGLRDPISDDPRKIAQDVGLFPGGINFQLEPYLSLAPELVKRRLDKLIRDIQTHRFDFEAGGASIAAESGAALQSLLQALRESDVLARQLDHRIRVEIQGHTSEEGSDKTNQRLALARAQGVLSTLNAERFQAIDFLAVAEPVIPPVIGETQSAKFERARRVSFHVTVYDSGSTGASL